MKFKIYPNQVAVLYHMTLKYTLTMKKEIELKTTFTVKLKQLICNLKNYKSNYDVDNIKTLFINNVSILKENDLLNATIEKLTILSEKDITNYEADDFVVTLSQYWFDLIETYKFHIVFYGEYENFLALSEDLNKNKISNIEFINMDTERFTPSPLILNGTYPVAIYDDKGSAMLKEKEIFLDYIYIPSMSFHKEKIHINLEYAKYLDHEYKKIKSIKNIVTGASHAWHAFPDSLTTSASNMSMHSGDLTYASAIINNLENHKNTYSYVHITSPFELFHELSLSLGFYSKEIFNSIRATCKNNNIPYNYSIHKNSKLIQNYNAFQQFTSEKNNITLSMTDILIEMLIIKKEISNDSCFLDNDIDEEILRNSLCEGCLPHNFIKRQNSKEYQPKDMHVKSCIDRSTLHSKLYKRKNSFDVNKKNVESIIKSIKLQKTKIYFIMPPYPHGYISNIDKNMLDDTIRFFKSWVDNESVYFIDYSNDEDFIRSDFLDGDHLNFNGARKFISKLSKIGITL